MNPNAPSRWQKARYPLTVALCLATLLLTLPFRAQLDLANIDMIFLLCAFAVAIWFGRGPAVLAAFLGVALFDFFFVPPYLSFAVANAQYLITFAVMLAVALITSQLVASLAERTAQAKASEHDARQLYELARELGTALHLKQVSEILGQFHAKFDLDAILLVGDSSQAEPVLEVLGPRRLGLLELSFARSALVRNAIVETDSLSGTGAAILFLPLATAHRVRGVLASVPRTEDLEKMRRHRPLLEAAASVAAITIERLHYAEVAQHVEIEIAAERLRNSILASLSHDLRTPLTSLVGLAESLLQIPPAAADNRAETANTIRDQARAMHRVLTNLLDLARLQSGSQTLNLQWQPIDEVIGSSVRILAEPLSAHPLLIEIPENLPLVQFDAVLLERVICNLLENATKYALPKTPISVAARVREGSLELSIDNEGPGFPQDRMAQVFECFVRGDAAGPIDGTGLGLAIGKAIVQAHGGAIEALNRPGGATVRFTLPLGDPPPLDEEALA